MEPAIEQQLDSQHGAARRLCRFVRISRLAQRRSEHHPGADLYERQRLLAGGTPALRKAPCRRARSISRSATRPNPYLSAGFFWYTEGNSSYNSLQIDLSRRLSRGLADPRQLHLVEESGHQLRAHRRAGQQPGADGHGPQRSASRLGPFRAQRQIAVQHSRPATNCRSVASSTAS